MKFLRSSVVAMAAMLAACGAITKTETAIQPIGQPLMAGVGDIVLRVNKERSLANVAGKADVFGRKTNEGFTEIRYLGLDADGSVVFARQDLAVETNETTVTRMGAVPISGLSTTQMSGRLGNSNFSGTATNTGTNWVPAPRATSVAVPLGVILIRLAPGQLRIIRVGTYTVRVGEANSALVSYSVEK